MEPVTEHDVEPLGWTWSFNVKLEFSQPEFTGTIWYDDAVITFYDAPTPATGRIIQNFMSRRADQITAIYDDEGNIKIDYVLDNGEAGIVELEDANFNDVRAGLANIVEESDPQPTFVTDFDLLL